MHDDGRSTAMPRLWQTLERTADDNSHRRRQAALGIWAGLVLIAVVLISRRVAGTATGAVPGWFALSISGFCFGFGIAASRLVGRNSLREGERSRWLMTTLHIGLSGILPGIIGLILAPAGATAVQMSVVTMTVLAVTALTQASRMRQLPDNPEATVQVSRNRQLLDEPNHLPGHAGTSSPDVVAPQRSPLIWMSRRMSEDGRSDIVEGVATAVFRAGQKQAVLHVAFCPSLPETPQVDCEPADGDDVRWKIAVAAPYGIRVDVTRRSDIDHPADIPISYFASASRPLKKVA